MIRRISNGGLTHLLSILSSNIGLNFYAKVRVSVFSKLAKSHDLVSIPCDREDLKGGLTHLRFLLSSNISWVFYAKFGGQRFLETGDVSRPGTNSM